MNTNKEKKSNWVQVGEIEPLFNNKEDCLDKVLDNVETEEDLNNLISLEENTKEHVKDQVIDKLENVLTKEYDRQLENLQRLKNDLAKEIYQYIVKNPDVKAKEIASHFKCTRKMVNHYLYKKTEYGLNDFVVKNKYDQWRIKGE